MKGIFALISRAAASRRAKAAKRARIPTTYGLFFMDPSSTSAFPSSVPSGPPPSVVLSDGKEREGSRE